MLEIITPPVVDEDFLALVYDHLKIEAGDPEDTYSDPGEEEILDLVDSYVEAALGKIESASGRVLFKRTCRLTLDAFSRSIALPVSPVIAVTGITYLDTVGDEQTLDGAAHALLDRLEWPKLIAARGHTWPETWDFPGSVKITFDAGYGEGMETIPAQLRMATMQTVADWFRFGGNVATTSLSPLPADARRACKNFRRVWQ